VAECFGQYADRIYAVETGLSSDPAMNWQVPDLDRRAIVSFSDAHSPKKLGREATVFLPKNGIPPSQLPISQLTFNDIYWAIAERFLGKNEGRLKIGYTIEFYPEEGKYHYTGHRNCGVVQSPEETRQKGAVCHVCGRPLTVGVEHRVSKLTGNRQPAAPVKKTSEAGVTGYYHPTDSTRPPYVKLVPLAEIIGEALNTGPASKKVDEVYENLVKTFGSEFEVLLKTEIEAISRAAGERLAEGIARVRRGEISVKPGYDGVFGVVKIWPIAGEENALQSTAEQASLF
jgi:uncharacterized protein (TIGR00375 family)